MRDPLITTLSLLIAAAQARPHDFEYRVYQVINRLIDIAEWSDERRADLYALLADSIKFDDKLTVIDKKVTEALAKNKERFNG